MKPSVYNNDGDLLVQSGWVAGVSLAENVVGLTHILGRRRLICSTFIAEILLRDFQSPTTIEEIAHRRNAHIDLIRDVVGYLRNALLLKTVDTDEKAAVRYGLDIQFVEPNVPMSDALANEEFPPALFLNPADAPADATAVSEMTLDTPLQLSPAIAAMPFDEGAGGVITHFLEGPLLLADDLWRLAMTFRDRITLRQAIASAGLQTEDPDQLLLSAQFLFTRRILCSSAEADAERTRAAVRPQIELIRRRFEVDKDLTPTGYEDPHFIWYQPFDFHDIGNIRPQRSRGRVAILGQCQSHFIAGALEFLAQRTGWHLETHGWFDAPQALATQAWSLVVLPTVVEVAAFYEAFAAGDPAGCRKALPQVVAEVNANVCEIREKTDAPILIIAAGEPTLHGHGTTSPTRHALKHLLTELNDRLLRSLTGFERIHLLDETRVLSEYPDMLTLDDAYNAAPHHCGFDLWSWRDDPFRAAGRALPQKTDHQMHPALPLARACLEHMRHIYMSRRVQLIVFEPNGLLWPGILEAGSKPWASGINVYTGLADFLQIGIHEALCTVRGRGIRLACLSSSDTELLRESLQYDSAARNLVRSEDVECALGGEDKSALLEQILALTNVREEDVLWIDPAQSPPRSFEGRVYAGDIWNLRRYLLSAPALRPVTETVIAQPRAAVSKSEATRTVPNRDEVSRALDRILVGHLNCTEKTLQQTDDLSLLGLDSFGSAALVLELEDKLKFRLPDQDYIGSVVFSRKGLSAAITRALESVATDRQSTANSPTAWFDSFTRERWCEQDLGSVIAHHAANPGVGWIMKFVRSGKSFDYQYVTWNELYGRSLGYTRLFRSTGLTPGDTITILLPQGLSLITAIIGAVLGGMIPSVSAFPSEKLTSQAFLSWFGALVRNSNTRCVVCTGELEALVSDELAAHEAGIPIVTTVPDPVLDEAVFAASPDSAVLLQHSSGTTGIKKGVMLTHRALLAQIWDLSKALECNDEDVIVSWLPYYHDMGLIACLMLPLLRSIPAVVMSPFDWVRQPHLLLHEISEERGTLCWLPNFALLHSANRTQADQLAGLELDSLRAVVNCSEPVTYDAMRAFYERFSRFGVCYSALSASYAMAENTFAVTQTQTGRPAKTIQASAPTFAREGKIRKVPASGNDEVTRFVSSGSVLLGSRVRIVKEGRELGEGEAGEIQVYSDYLFAGYENDDEASRDVFDDEWFRTGDLGFLLEGELYVTGREKDLIIISGHNVYPHDIEAEIGALPGIRPGRAVAFGIYDEKGGTEKLVLMAEIDSRSSSGETGPDEDTLKLTIRDTVLSRYFVNVSDIRLVQSETLRKSTSGKLARNANRELYLEMNTLTTSLR